ncbi:MAG: DUF2470 domain-containing protein [Gordonia sp. (in: high G+C Gram-positive bacteria)]
MTRAITDRPSDAEVIATACRRAGSAMLAVEGGDASTELAAPTQAGLIHLFDTQAFLLVPTAAAALHAAAAAADGLPAMVEITDCAPIELREPVRSLIWLNGTLHPVPRGLERELALEIVSEHPDEELLDIGHGRSMMRLQIDTAVVASGSGAASVAVADLACATPDPFWEYEDDWISHLDGAHADLIERLARRLPRHLRQGRVRPLGLDRFGIRFRIEGSAGDSDVRLPFPHPVGDIAELSRALRGLAGCPFLNSLPD